MKQKLVRQHVIQSQTCYFETQNRLQLSCSKLIQKLHIQKILAGIGRVEMWTNLSLQGASFSATVRCFC